MHLLLLEPDIQLGKIYSRFLESSGYSLDWCTNAQTALHCIDEQRPDAVVLELQLPAHNGIEFLYEFRSYKDWQAIPVLVHSQVPPALRAVSPMLWDELGVASYQYKPFTKLRDLLRAIEIVLAPA